MKIRLRQDVPSAIVNDVLTTILLSKGMVVVLKDLDSMRAESKSTGRTVTIVLGVVRDSKHRVCCVSMHGCAAPYIDLGMHSRGGGGGGGDDGGSGGGGGYGHQSGGDSRSSRGNSFTDMVSNATGAVSDLLMMGSDNNGTGHNRNSRSSSSSSSDVFAGIGLDVYTQTLFESLRISFQNQGLTLSSMMQHKPYFDFESSSNANSGNSASPTTAATLNKVRTDSDDPKDVLVSSDYLRQLRDAYRNDMIYELTSYAEPLDKYVHEAEW